MDRKKLAQAIVAWDVVFQDILGDLNAGEPVHTVAERICDALIAQIAYPPDIDSLMETYMINMSDMGARIRLVALSHNIDDDHVRRVIALQEERLETLRELFYEPSRVKTH